MSPMWSELSFIAAILLMVLVMGTALLILWLIFRGKIDLSQILNESDAKKASLSRFQFLLFTFVIAGLFLLLSIESGAFVNIPDSVLGLLGISAGSYAVSKGINSSADAKERAKTKDKTYKAGAG
jgi:sterol desaturase/sphingolipid hydroxylase (fatty acid hydroxylase superfamily)